MKFKGYGIAWDPERDKPLCQFNDGIYETDDSREIEILKKNGYESEEDPKKKSTKSKGAE